MIPWGQPEPLPEEYLCSHHAIITMHQCSRRIDLLAARRTSSVLTRQVFLRGSGGTVTEVRLDGGKICADPRLKRSPSFPEGTDDPLPTYRGFHARLPLAIVSSHTLAAIQSRSPRHPLDNP